MNTCLLCGVQTCLGILLPKSFYTSQTYSCVQDSDPYCNHVWGGAWSTVISLLDRVQWKTADRLSLCDMHCAVTGPSLDGCCFISISSSLRFLLIRNPHGSCLSLSALIPVFGWSVTPPRSSNLRCTFVSLPLTFELANLLNVLPFAVFSTVYILCFQNRFNKLILAWMFKTCLFTLSF